MGGGTLADLAHGPQNRDVMASNARTTSQMALTISPATMMNLSMVPLPVCPRPTHRDLKSSTTQRRAGGRVTALVKEASTRPIVAWVRIQDVRRLPLGTFTRPTEETGGAPRVEGVYGYLLRHDDGLVLLDTGMGRGDDETEAWYQPQRIALPEALATAGVGVDELDLVANCHLHFDHCGGNPLLGTTPVLCQREELATARAGDYTFEHLLDGVRFELLDGEAEPLPGLHVIPTPGHVDGHQSLVVECADGSVVLAGQSHESATAWADDARRTPPTQLWMERLLSFDPRQVVFAHDDAVWRP